MAERRLGELLRHARQRLAGAGIADAAFDARLLVEHFSGTTRSDAITSPDRLVPQVAEIEAALDRRIAGEPVHRILGYRDFYGMRLSLSTETLEPRPDTETLVDAVLPFVRETAARDGVCRILDLGTGTGAIALALVTQEPKAVAIGVDVSEDALATAAANAQALGVSSRFTAKKSDWFAEIQGRHHLIVSNPPYITSSEIENLQNEVRNFDPRRALDGGPDGLEPYRMIASGAGRHLEEGGLVGLEIGHDQRHDVTVIFEQAGYHLSAHYKDLGGNDRVLAFHC
ncbi:peptide chain release factor N(5)-glutamine methyltransferase [Aminobacter aminovorans]|uniref:peptide chain release factor N(5)-glutamine methyltransferase n=1 Tax=Aminobacter aminovorans TaxID=83263 RepID=UPI0028658385|nr:peptide chain release factor N(5)-glutamine methyltransferase [Aminobacter aminovorans]MDR7224837.1 release factor glutamine methyltransferase [Aminobacter aminovorans]